MSQRLNHHDIAAQPPGWDGLIGGQLCQAQGNEFAPWLAVADQVEQDAPDGGLAGVGTELQRHRNQQPPWLGGG